ncbi:hypothetical protein KI387_035847, partial [Taxus chinensis]
VATLAAMIIRSGYQGGDDTNEEEFCEEEEMQVPTLAFKERMLRGLEEKNDGIGVDVSEYG